MKNVLCALLLSTTALFSIQPLQAADVDKIPVLWARDNMESGSFDLTSSDQPVPFASESKNRSGGTISRLNDSLFLLEPGVYQIIYVGEYRTTAVTETINAQYQVAFRINGTQLHFRTQDSLSVNAPEGLAPPFNPIATTTLIGAFDFDTEKTLEVVSKEIYTSTDDVHLHTRSIIITKLQ